MGPDLSLKIVEAERSAGTGMAPAVTAGTAGMLWAAATAELDHGEEVSAELVVARADSAEVLQLEQQRSMRLRSRWSRLLKHGFHIRSLFGGMLGVAP